MTAARTRHRRPLVFCATVAAMVEAEKLLPPGAVLENEVELALERDGVHGDCEVVLDGGIIVELRPKVSRTGRAAWQPIAVRRGGRS